jgi:hypothetical protein
MSPVSGTASSATANAILDEGKRLMGRGWLALTASTLAACTSVTRVSITPDQLHDLAGLAPSDERKFVPRDSTERMIARGDDPVRLLLRPGRPGLGTEGPWVGLCQLRWEPPYGFGSDVPTGTISDGVLRVPATELAGAELQITQPDEVKTTILVLGLVLGVSAAALLATWLAYSFQVR